MYYVILYDSYNDTNDVALVTESKEDARKEADKLQLKYSEAAYVYVNLAKQIWP